MTVLRRAWAAPLWAHALAYAVVLLAVFPLMKPDASFSNDEGAYATQAAALREGRWAYEYEALPADPETRHFPIILDLQRADSTDHLPYVHHPAYARGLAVVTDVVGETAGLHLPALAGALLAAVAAWLLAAELAPGAERIAFWVAATGPVLVNAYVIWAHALSAGLAGLTLVVALRVARSGPTPLRVLGVAVGVAAGVLLRSEAVFFAVVPAAVLLTAPVRPRWRAGLLAAVPLAVAAVTKLGERAVIRRLAGGAVGEPERTAEAPFLEGRIRGLWHDLLSGVYTKERAGDVLVVALVLVVAGALLARRRRAAGGDPSRLLAVVAVLACGLIAVRVAMAPRDTVTGLFPAWPVMGAGLVLLSWRDLTVPVRALVGSLAVFTAAVVATNYPFGGGLEWGGRFFSPALVPLAALAAVGLRRMGRAGAPLTGALLVATAVMGLVLSGGVRGLHDGQVAAAERHLRAWTITDYSPLPRLGWRLDDDTAWLLADVHPVDSALDVVRRMGGGDVLVIQRREKPVEPLARYGAVEEHRERDLNRLGFRVLTLRRQ